MSEPSSPPDEVPEEAPTGPGLAAALLRCDNCGRETPHRVLRLDRASRPGSDRVRGIARCRECRLTHPFDTPGLGEVELPEVISDGAKSVRTRVRLPRSQRIQVGSGVPRSEVPVRVARIDDRKGRQVSEATAGEVGTLWVVRDVGAVVSVSVVEGSRTRTLRWTVPRGTRYSVGDRLSADDRPVDVVALRARGRTWRREGDSFLAEEVQRLFARPAFTRSGLPRPRRSVTAENVAYPRKDSRRPSRAPRPRRSEERKDRPRARR